MDFIRITDATKIENNSGMLRGRYIKELIFPISRILSLATENGESLLLALSTYDGSVSYIISEEDYNAICKVLLGGEPVESVEDVTPELQVEGIEDLLAVDDPNIMEPEKERIVKALNKCGGNRKSAAALLGLSERTLYRKIKEYKL